MGQKMLLKHHITERRFTLQKLIRNTRIVGLMLCSFVFICVSENTKAMGQLGASEDAQSDKFVLYQSMLAGGALSTCSSLSRHNCRTQPFSSEHKSSTLYEINEASITRLELFIQNDASRTTKEALSSILPQLHKRLKNKPLNRKELFDQFERFSLLTQVDELDDIAYFALLDHLEFAQLDSNGVRKKEFADINASISLSSIAVYNTFVEQVKQRAKLAQQKPHIVVLTSSARDPFEVADFYVSAFSSLGVTTTWLPIDASLANALDQKQRSPDACVHLDDFRQQHGVFDRERIYPEFTRLQQQMCEQPKLIISQIESAQGLFINGGDQSKTLAAIMSNTGQFTDYWQHVLTKVDNFEMIIGGTSAGAAVQAGNFYNHYPIPMISNGTSTQAIKRGAFAALAPSQRCISKNCQHAVGKDDLTFTPSGGAGVFSIGTVDTHFSERDREGRLITLAVSQSVRLAVGVDETSALLFRRVGDVVDLSILGKNGVFMVDGYHSSQMITLEQGIKSTKYAGFAHYLPSGTKATLNLTNNNWDLSAKVRTIDERENLPLLDQGVWRNSTRKYCGTKDPIKWEIDGITYVVAPSKETQFFIDPNRQFCGYLFLPFIVSG